MDPYCSCFYSIVTSCWHTILWPWLYVVTEVILAILSLLAQHILLTINNDLCYFNLPAVSKFMCLPKTSIYCRMCCWWIPSCSVIRLTPSSWRIGLSNTRWIKICLLVVLTLVFVILCTYWYLITFQMTLC